MACRSTSSENRSTDGRNAGVIDPSSGADLVAEWYNILSSLTTTNPTFQPATQSRKL